MNRQTFQKTYGEELRKFVSTPCGQAMLAALGAQRPPYEFSVQNHLLVENRGAMRGYELCLRNILSLSTPINPPEEIEATYGVAEPKI